MHAVLLENISPSLLGNSRYALSSACGVRLILERSSLRNRQLTFCALLLSGDNTCDWLRAGGRSDVANFRGSMFVDLGIVPDEDTGTGQNCDIPPALGHMDSNGPV